MNTSPALQGDEAAIKACTISRDVQNFDLLIEDMEAELGENWGDLSFEDAAVFLTQPEGASLEFVAIAIDEGDEPNLGMVGELIKTAAKRKVKVIVIAEEVSPVALHQLLKLGAQEFVPYPLPEGALHDAIGRLRAPVHSFEQEDGPKTKAMGDKNGIVLAVHGMAGGVGATTLAVNLAWELATMQKKSSIKVCLLDLDLQFGSTATYLDMQRKDSVFELLSDTASMDNDSFLQAMQVHEGILHVLTAPPDILPLDLIGPEDVDRIVTAARTNFDYVIVDMPRTVVVWTETVLNASDVYIVPMEIDMRSAQNTLKMVRALKTEDLPVEKLRYALNRAPGGLDLSGKSRVKRLAESLDIKLELLLPDGGKQVMECGDQGMALAEVAGKNPLRKEIQKLAASIHASSQALAQARQ
ncbi:MAG: AAA family ATPase [Rhodobacteraceae bacterium]|nr:AAA family ATPase [Paracoccaceae bacterium]